MNPGETSTACAVCHKPFTMDNPRSSETVHTCCECAYADMFAHCAEPHPVNAFPRGRWLTEKQRRYFAEACAIDEERFANE